MTNYVIFIDDRKEPLDYQAVKKALAGISVEAGGWKKLSERDEAYFDGTLCVDCKEDPDEEE